MQSGSGGQDSIHALPDAVRADLAGSPRARQRTVHLALFQPDIPQNTGTLLRLAACLSVPVHIIEPCGFLWGERQFRRAGMDYLACATLTRHPSWDAFQAALGTWDGARLVLLTTRGSMPYTRFDFRPGDVLLCGQESAGAPEAVHAAAAARISIPMALATRSLNVAVAAAMVIGEALRQTAGFPETRP